MSNSRFKNKISDQHKEDQKNFEEWRDGCLIKIIVYPVLAALFITLLYAVATLNYEVEKQIVKDAIEETKTIRDEQ